MSIGKKKAVMKDRLSKNTEWNINFILLKSDAVVNKFLAYAQSSLLIFSQRGFKSEGATVSKVQNSTSFFTSFSDFSRFSRFLYYFPDFPGFP